jgi:cold shock CspA family protein
MTKTQIKGVLKTWKEDRGFGFISPEDGGKDIFIHISALKGMSRRPVTGDVIYYQSARDNQGKFKAVNAYIEGVEVLKGKSTRFFNTKKGITLIVLGILVIVTAIVAIIYSP